ncbi:MAG TPA: MCE family protein [Aquifex aeolicus]|nr:MCE family protein [Aquifex aeolicus]
MNNNTWKVGALVAVSALAFAGTVLFFGELPFFKSNKAEYYAYFDNVGGLSKGSDVRVSGVKVGKVKEILFEKGEVKVVLEVQKGVPIYRDAVAKIGTLGLLGDKYVEIQPGHPESGELPPQSVIFYTQKPSDITDLITNMSKTAQGINKLTANLNRLVQNLNTVLVENRKNLNQTLEHIERISKNLEMTLPQLTENYNKLAQNLNALLVKSSSSLENSLKNIKQLTDSLKRELPILVRNLNIAVKTFADNRNSIEKTLENLEQITKKINKGQGTLGKLINDKVLYKELKRSVKTLAKVSNTLVQTQLHIEAFAQHEGTGDSKAGINVIFQPDDTKYYLFGVVGDSAGKISKKIIYQNGSPVEVTEKKYRPEFNLQYARIFPDRWFHRGSSIVLRIGIKESTGGIGADYVFNERLMFSFDLWDFGRADRPYEDLKPNTELGIKYMFYSPFFVKAGGYDLLNKRYRTVFFGGGMSFTDNDLKYLLGGIKLPSF